MKQLFSRLIYIVCIVDMRNVKAGKPPWSASMRTDWEGSRKSFFQLRDRARTQGLNLKAEFIACREFRSQNLAEEFIRQP